MTAFSMPSRNHWAFPSLLAVGAACFLAACSAPRIENVPLAAGSAGNPERRELDISDPARPLILMTFSGGGTRAAVLASSVVRELDRHSYQTATGVHRLSEDIQIVSSVSGGSVTAAWLALHGPKGLDELDAAFLNRDEMGQLIDTALSPVTWFRLAFTDYTRVDALESLLDRQLFHGAKMGSINQPGRPYVVLNATDMSSGEVFDFTPAHFDDICADFDQTPVAVGVAASAAFPVALSPVTMQNYSAAPDAPGCHLKEPQWMTLERTVSDRRYSNLTRFKDARYASALRRTGPGQIDYLHLLDGGVADNLGVTSLDKIITRPTSPVPLLRYIVNGQVRKIVVITVNARSDKPRAIDRSAAGAGLVASVSSVTSVPIDAATAGMGRQIETLMHDLDDAVTAGNALNDPMKVRFGSLKTYSITIDFDQFLADQGDLQACVKVVPTSWSLTPEQLTDVRTSGTVLLNQHPKFQSLLADLGAPPPVATGPLKCAVPP